MTKIYKTDISIMRKHQNKKGNKEVLYEMKTSFSHYTERNMELKLSNILESLYQDCGYVINVKYNGEMKY